MVHLEDKRVEPNYKRMLNYTFTRLQRYIERVDISEDARLTLEMFQWELLRDLKEDMEGEYVTDASRHLGSRDEGTDH